MLPSTNTEPNITIHYEDSDLLVIDKPADLLSQKDHTGDIDLTTLIKQYLAEKSQRSSPPYIGLLHRLDRPVSGLIMLAKNSRAASKCSRMMANQTIDKTYVAVVGGKAAVNGYLEDFLIKDQQRNIVRISKPGNNGAKKAILTYQRLSYHTSKKMSLIKVHLVTGRSHQIRVQLANQGLPILFDQKYSTNSKSESPNRRDEGTNTSIALKSTVLRFWHPFTKREISCTALPDINTFPWNYFYDELSNLK